MTEVVKKNLRRMISRNADGISAPEIIKALLRKSEKDLKKELQKFQSQPYSEEEGNRLLTFAFGWPKGIRILLESGIDARSFQLRPVCAGLFETESLDSDDYYDSIKILLDAQCRLDLDDIVFFRSKIIRSLLIQEVVKRRKELWRLAQAYLPVNVIDKFRKEGDELIDTDLPTICEALAEVRGDTDHGISENYWRFQGGSVYHSYAITGSSIIQLEALDEMYAAGFRDIDVPDQRGMTPLMLCSFDDYLFRSAIWFISKGANYLRKFPYSNATIAHSWSASLTYNVWLDAGRWTLEQPQRSRLERWKTGLKEHGKSIFLLPSVRDSCMCPCCPGGCTTLSVIFRCTEDLVRQVNSGAVNSAKIFSLWMTDEPAPDLGKRLNSTAFQELLRIVMEFCKERPGSEQTIMRSLTFEALRLKHVCCVEINQRFPWAGTGAGAMGKSEGEIEEIMAEEKEQYEMFEQLMVELTAKFDELGLPIAQFLADYWHKRMIEFLSERDPYNEEHHKEARRAGIILEEAPIEIPELVYIVANTVEEIE
ncbi:hypothetical protein N7456_002635 [Penicillium angulare]|uniref:Uncharacterized protein n=1 Tax=Penicillium angulare TaxID=116970 RepID=A0A9W9G8K8_9EURO|nr:hypothetical protein N7456_002635 [Penicillium angulare]